MFRQYGIGAGLSLLILSSTAQAAPLINVTSDHLQLSSYAQLIDSHGTPQLWESNYSGRVLSGDREVAAFNDWIYSEETWGCCDTGYEEFSVLTHANLSLGGNVINLFAESDKYPSGVDQDDPPGTYYTSVELGAMASVDWRFEVSDGDVELHYYAADEFMRVTNDYPAGWVQSLASIEIFDETDNVEILNVAGWAFGNATLSDGHSYRLSAIARDDHLPSRYLNEEDVVTGFSFSGAEIAYVDEPPVLVLIGFGLLSLISVRGLGRGFSQVSMS